MKKFIVFLVFCSAFFSCEPEEASTPPPIEPVIPTEPAAKPMRVTEVFPAKNDIGDTITIKGENFKRDLTLFLHNNTVTPILLNDSIIKFRIPFASYDPFDFQLKLKRTDEEKILHNPYELYAPVIDSIPGMFAFKDTIVLYGRHMINSPAQKNNILFLNDQEVPVISHSRDSIVFKLPWQAKKFEYDVLVKAQLQQATMPAGLTIQPPAVKGFSKTSVEIGEVITIYGSFFYSNNPSWHKVSFQGNRAEVLESYRDSLKVRIPMGPYKSRKINELKIQLFEKETNFIIDMDIVSIWYMYGYKKDYEISQGTGISRWSFSANGAFYFNVNRPNSQNIAINNVLYKYMPEEDQWEEIDLTTVSSVFDYGDLLEFYHQKGSSNVIIHLYRDTDNFYKFNLETRELEQLEDHPIENFLQQGIGFHLNGHFYFGHGYTWDMGTIPNRMFWRYDYSFNTWTEVGEMPDMNEEYSRLGTSIFSTDNSVIIGNGHPTAYDLYEFSSNETWSRKSDVLEPNSGAIHVQIEQRGFYSNYNGPTFWEYDIPVDEWTKRDDLKIGYYNTGQETLFIYGDYVYYVGYLQDYGPDGTPYFRNDHIILRTELSNF